MIKSGLRVVVQGYLKKMGLFPGNSDVSNVTVSTKPFFLFYY